MLDHALAHARDGWNVFPLAPGTKIPMRGSKGAHDGTQDEAQIRKWWTETPKAGIGANLGDDRVVIDVDIQHGGVFLDSFPRTRKHISGRGNGNAHLIYRYAPNSAAAMFKSDANVLGMGIDIRIGRGSYIVMPPTLHEETRQPYTNGGGLEHELTDPEVEAMFEEAGLEMSARTKAAAKGITVVGGRAYRGPDQGPSQLADLLLNPPQEGGRNDWLSKVAGHYAKQYRDKEDLYQAQMQLANNLLASPLPDAEFQKTTRSIWGSEATRVRESPARALNEDTGYLRGNGRTLFVQVRIKEGDMIVEDTAVWGNFDIIAEGVAIDDQMQRKYWVRLLVDGQEIRTILDPDTLNDSKSAKKWFGRFAASWVNPINAYPPVDAGTRIQRYLESQDPPSVTVVETLGYQETASLGAGFVTHDGWIDQTGFTTKEDAGIVADPGLMKDSKAPFHYGFEGTRTEALDVLREVLTFQDDRTTALFGSWWAACFLKPQFHEVSSLFPIFGVEATSESGKTTGFFNLMVQLNGNYRGNVAPTVPVLRDYAAANYNGIVWVDDLDSLKPYEELMRASTTNGNIAKMGMDNTAVKSFEIVAPMLISGEYLGFSTQKALADRSVVVNVTSPKGRKSVKDPKRMQWDDVMDLQARFNRKDRYLSVLAGWYVVESMKYSRQAIIAFLKLKGPGRDGNKHGIMMAGAQLLDSILAGSWTEDGQYFQEVRRWSREQSSTALDQDNTLTREILPWALRTWDEPTTFEITERGKFSSMYNPVIVRKSKDPMATLPEIWYSTVKLADVWKRENPRVEGRTEGVDALAAQARALGGKTMNIAGVKARRLPDEYVQVVLERSRG